MITYFIRKTVAITVMSAVSAIGSAAYADNSVKVEPDDNDSIVTLLDFHVVGHKIKQTKMLPFDVDEKHLPINMAKVDRKMLENRDINDISSATRFLPSVKTARRMAAFRNSTSEDSQASSSLQTVSPIRDRSSRQCLCMTSPMWKE